MRYSTEQWLIGLLLTALAALSLWFLFARHDVTPETAITSETSNPTSASEPAGPRFPVRPPIELSESDRNALVPLPDLSDSDEYFKLELVNQLGKSLENLLAKDRLIEKFVATVDNLPRDRLAERLRPIQRVPGHFAVESAGGDDSFLLSGENSQRYTFLIDMLRHADAETLVNTYRRYYPLMQESYQALGYPDGYFNDRVVEVIDHLLATPDSPGPLTLKRPNVLYEFSNPELESLSSGQKIMLRMGKDNAASVKQVLRELRALLVTPDDVSDPALPD